MKQIFLMIGKNLLQQFLNPPARGHDHSLSHSLLDPVKEYASDTMKKYALVAVLGFLFTLYFVAGTLMMITATAESFDAFGFFAPGAFFYSGLGITLISIAVLGGCYASVKKSHKPKIKPEVVPAVEHSAMPHVNFAHVAEAVMAGVISGLVSRRIARPANPEPRTLRERLREVI